MTSSEWCNSNLSGNQYDVIDEILAESAVANLHSRNRSVWVCKWARKSSLISSHKEVRDDFSRVA